MNNLLVSVILPYYKKDEHVHATVKSILNQTYKNLEILIVDDELSPESKDVMKDLKKTDCRITVISNGKNLGAGLSRNKAIEIAKGNYIAFCDCDDLWHKTKLETQLKFMESHKIDFSHTSYAIINNRGNVIGCREADNEIKFNQLIKSCDIGLSTVLMKKNLFDQTDINFPKLKTKEDFVLWLKLSQNGIRMFGLKNKLTYWRKLNNSLSSSTFQKLSDGFKVYRIYMKYSIAKSIIYLFILSLNFLIKKNNKS